MYLPVLASGFEGLEMGHPYCCESPNLHIFELLIEQEGALSHLPLPVLVPGCGKLGRGLLRLGGLEWGTETIMSPQILTHVTEHFHHQGRDRTVCGNIPVVLPGAEGLGMGHWVTLTVMNPQSPAHVIEHFSIQKGVESFLVTYPPHLILPCSWI